MKTSDDLRLLEGKCLKYERVGSRVTCNPAPTDTDDDVLVLTTSELWDNSLGKSLAIGQFEKGGSDCGDQRGYLASVELSFQSFKLGDLNLIITFDPNFYRRFMAATGIAKHLNLLDKGDRIKVFQAVLYGNEPFPVLPPPFPAFRVTPPAEYMRPFWVRFESGRSGCVEALNADQAKALGAELTGSAAIECDRLPYPAQPRLSQHEDPAFGVCPSFCYAPGKCKGRSSCPQRISCTE